MFASNKSNAISIAEKTPKNHQTKKILLNKNNQQHKINHLRFVFFLNFNPALTNYSDVLYRHKMGFWCF